MHANELRRTFVDFFRAREHELVPSASLIPHDATLLFTNSGMVPFKPYFIGEQKPPYPRAVSVQKCVRAGGKHNDLDEVGRTSRHLTFFEMMGNFSFGDYFKETAIPYAWELVTETLGIDPDRLWITVHLSDDEAADIWRDAVGVAPERIQRLDEDNWWRMADTGPNGPCSEIFFDKGPALGADGGPAHGGEERFIELWNLVFMQYEQTADGSQNSLPHPSIDTGAGLERILSVLAGVDSVWETDEFVRLLDTASSMSGVRDGDSEATDVSLRIFADHARSSTFLVADGVFPSNEDRGYVLRRIVRRAVRHAYILGIAEPVMGRLVDAVVDIMGDDYAEIVSGHDVIRDVLDREEIRFRETLETGSSILDAELDRIAAVDGGTLDGEVAFTLHDTYGFPLEVTQEIADERGILLDQAGFDAAMAQQRRRAKEAHERSKASSVDVSVYRELIDEHGATDFVGRDHDEATARVLFVADDTVILDRTPFYAESGGQIGDVGTIVGPAGRAEVIDCVNAVPDLYRHVLDSVDGELRVGDEVTATIDAPRRSAIRRNHTATHLLHAALRRVLGEHVKQQGSWVGPDRLRFDFSHYEALTDEQIVAIEDDVNSEILANPACRHYETTMDAAIEAGAIAFFGDKYGDVVRVLEAGAHSTELCGGTHVGALGDIGSLKIVGEGSIGSNLRRVEAVTGFETLDRLRRTEATIGALANLLKSSPDNVVDDVSKRLDEIKSLRAELRDAARDAALGRAGALAESADDGVVIARVDDLDQASLRDLAVAVRNEGIDTVVLGGTPGKGVFMAAAVAPTGANNAGEILASVKGIVGGGGRPGDEVAAIGGKNIERIDEALETLRASLLG